MTYMGTPQHKNPCPGGHEIYNFGRPFLCHHNYILSLSVLCLGVEKKILKEIMHFHYIIYMNSTQHKNPCPGVMKFTILVDPSLVNITLYIVCLINNWEQRRKIFKAIMHFHYMTYMATPQHKNPCPGVMKFTIWVDPSFVHHYYTLSLSETCP